MIVHDRILVVTLRNVFLTVVYFEYKLGKMLTLYTCEVVKAVFLDSIQLYNIEFIERSALTKG